MSNHEPSIAELPKGTKLLHEPSLNKGTSFTAAECDALGLRGLLPPLPLPRPCPPGHFRGAGPCSRPFGGCRRVPEPSPHCSSFPLINSAWTIRKSRIPSDPILSWTDKRQTKNRLRPFYCGGIVRKAAFRVNNIFNYLQQKILLFPGTKYFPAPK